MVLAIDVGTSRIKASLVDAGGNLIGSTSISETSLEAGALLSAVASAIDDAIEGATGPITDVAFSTFWHGLLFLDAAKTPTGPISTWEDTTATPSAHALHAAVDPFDYHRRTGCFLHPSYPAVRIHAAVGRNATFTRILGPGEWLIMALFGEPFTSPSMASGTGLAKLNGVAYDDDTLEMVGVDATVLPPIRTEPLSDLKPEWAARWPVLATARWFLPVGDGAAETIGSDCIAGGRAAFKLGTSGAIRVVVDDSPVPPERLFTYTIDGKRALVGGATSNAGNLLAWARRTLGIDDGDIEAALGRPRGAHGLSVDPYLAGERAPKWAIESNGRIQGIRLSTTALDITQALIEAATDNLTALVEEVEAWHGRPFDLVASGGVIESHPMWTRLLVERLGRPLYAAPSPHSGARGAALLALHDLGISIPPAPLKEIDIQSLPRMRTC